MKKLHEMTAAELKAKAKELKIKGWWEMKKEELIVAIEAAQPIEEIVPEIVENDKDVVVKVEEKIVPELKEDDHNVAPKKKNQKRLIEYKGEVKTLTAWAKELGIRHQTLYNRIVMKGMDPVEAFEMPIKKAHVKEVSQIG